MRLFVWLSAKKYTTMKPMNHPILILIRGLPGSGKSYVAQALQKTLSDSVGADSIVMLDPDATDYTSKAYRELSDELTKQEVDAKFHPYRFLRAQAHNGITSSKIIIWNQPFTSFDGFNKTVINLQNYATEHNMELPMLVVEVEVDSETAKTRVVDRKQQGGHGPSDDTFTRFVNEYVSFSDKGYNTVTVYGSNDVAESVATIEQALDHLQ
jgi:thymidylate kinase